jgi:thymidylate synthase ThyX
MNFLELRLDKHAQYEIRQIAKQAEKHFADNMPITYKEWRRRYDYDKQEGN